jgi:hypothetical protein
MSPIPTSNGGSLGNGLGELWGCSVEIDPGMDSQRPAPLTGKVTPGLSVKLADIHFSEARRVHAFLSSDKRRRLRIGRPLMLRFGCTGFCLTRQRTSIDDDKPAPG